MEINNTRTNQPQRNIDSRKASVCTGCRSLLASNPPVIAPPGKSSPIRHNIPTPFPLKNFRSTSNNPHPSTMQTEIAIDAKFLYPRRHSFRPLLNRAQIMNQHIRPHTVLRADFFCAVLSALFGISQHKSTDSPDTDFKSQYHISLR